MDGEGGSLNIPLEAGNGRSGVLVLGEEARRETGIRINALHSTNESRRRLSVPWLHTGNTTESLEVHVGVDPRASRQDSMLTGTL